MSVYRQTHIIKFFVPLLIVILLCLKGFGQVSDGKIIIIVVDELGGVMTDNEVTLKISEDRALKKKTNKDGSVSFEKLVDGNYQIIINKKGFQPYRSESVNVKNGQAVSLKITLDVAIEDSTVNVDENDPDNADPQKFGGTRNLSRQEIDSLPDNPEDMELVLRQLAGPSLTGEKLPITVNGFSGAQLPPKAAIKQIRINQNVFSAQYEGSAGGGIEIFTRSGVEKFSGGLFLDLIDSRLNAANPFIGFRPPAQSRYYGGYLLGPLIRKRASFFVNLTRQEYTSNAIINAVVLNSSLQPTQFKASFPTSGTTIGSTSYVDFDITKKHQLHIGFQYNDALSKNQGIDALRLPSMAYDRRNQTATLQISETALISKALVNQTKFEFISTKLKQTSRNNSVITEVQDAFSDGGGQMDSVNSNRKFELTNDTTWQKDGYSLTFGGRIRGVFINDISFSNFGGRYIFSGGIAPALDANNNPVFDTNGNLQTESIGNLERYRRTLLFKSLGYSNSQIRSLGGGASQFFVEGGEPAAKINQFDFALYLQNSLSVRNDMSLSFGVRYENQTNIKSHLNFAPRFGVVYAPSVNQKKKTPLTTLPRISLGIGMFYQRVGEQLSFEAARFNQRRQYYVDDPNILDIYPNVPSLNLLEQNSLPTTKRILDSRIQAPYQILSSLSIDKKLPFKMNASVIFGLYKTNHALRSRNINAPLAGTYDLNDPSRAIYPLGKNAGDVYQNESSGLTKSKFLSFSLQTPGSKFTDFSINYSYRTDKDNLVSGSGSANPYDFGSEFAVSNNYIKHRFYMVNKNRLPFGIGIDNLLNISSGLPFNITLGRDLNGDNLFLERLAFASDLNKAGLVSTPYGLLDLNPAPTDTIIPRNLGRGHSTVVLDTILRRRFYFGDDKNGGRTYSLNLSVFANNILNINNEAVPIGNLASPNFLRSVTFASSAGLFGSAGPRRLRFSLGFSF